jgi:hypothetical protein
MLDFLRTFLGKFAARIDRELYPRYASIQRQLEELKLLQARQLLLQLDLPHLRGGIQCAEFQVFSQWGEDGIIQYLIHRLGVLNERFIEFGVQDYSESNTRFLLIHNNWVGLIIDGSPESIATIQKQDYYWRQGLKAVPAFITVENINRLLQENGFFGEIGLLSVDIDGNDYWVWEAITCVQPIIVICEYNSCFGDKFAVTVPYAPDFERNRVHPSSRLYFGASFRALCHLAQKKGYTFVGCNRNGINAFFVRNDHCGGIEDVIAEAQYVESRVQESIDAQGQRTFLTGKARLQEMANLEVFDVESQKIRKLQELL